MTQVTYDAEHFRPVLHRVRLHKPGDQHWQNLGSWPVGLDWRPGHPTFLSTVLLTKMYRRLFEMYDLRRQPKAQEFQLMVTQMNEGGTEGDPFFFFETMPIDDLDRDEYRRWQQRA